MVTEKYCTTDDPIVYAGIRLASESFRSSRLVYSPRIKLNINSLDSIDWSVVNNGADKILIGLLELQLDIS